MAALAACLPADRSQLRAFGERHESLVAGVHPPLRCAQAAMTQLEVTCYALTPDNPEFKAEVLLPTLLIARDSFLK